MGSGLKPVYTAKLLAELREAALRNAAELIDDARILARNKRHARAYFLAVAGLEEVGKAAIAHNNQRRDLSAPSVQSRIARDLDSHGAKIMAAFTPRLMKMELNLASNRERDAAQRDVLVVVDRIVALKRGREPSMYVDIGPSGRVQMPSELVRPVNAIDAPQLAADCLEVAREVLVGDTAKKTSAIEDRYYALGQKVVGVMKAEGFWKYYVLELEKLPRPVPATEQTATMIRCVVTFHDATPEKRAKLIAGWRSGE